MKVWVRSGAIGVLALAVWAAEQKPTQQPKPAVEQADENTRIIEASSYWVVRTESIQPKERFTKRY